MKRGADILISTLALLVMFPVLIAVMLVIWLEDRHRPYYVSRRVRSPKATYRMYKLRTMVPNADRIGGTSTSADDRRLTTIGRFVRACKLDEVPQFWNVLIGDMSIVGPRPQAVQDASLYTRRENGLFDVRPGITDFSSIVFADEAEILAGAPDPDQRYNELIRPWKSRLGLFYVAHHSLAIDLQLMALTALAIVSRRRALAGVQSLLRRLGADDELVAVAGRSAPLRHIEPPGAGEPGDNGPYLPT